MSVIETYKPVLLETDGSETDFDFDFSVFDDTDLVVAIVDPDTLEVISTPELGVDYTVMLNTSTVGGTVVFGTAPADGQLVSIRRNIPTTQGTDIPSGGLFRESQIENALDKAILLIQQLEESVSRALLQSPYSEALDLQFPAPVAGTVLGWNSAEDGLENKTLSGTGVMAIASQAQAEAGTGNDTLMTPLRTAQAIAELAANGLHADTTVNFNSSMTSAQIQALIDAQPKNLNGHTLTFQFAGTVASPQTYSLDATLNFTSFFGGFLFICGGSEDENTLHTNQGVILDHSSDTGIYVYNCSHVHLKNIKFSNPNISGAGLALQNIGEATVYGCYFLGDGKDAGTQGVYCSHVRGRCTACYFSNNNVGIQVDWGSTFTSDANGSTGTAPTYGIVSILGSIASLYGTQPAGTSASFIAGGAGQINQNGGAFPAAAWVNFDGTGTVAIRASGNVSSITDSGTGLYTVNFSTAMPDANYAAVTDVDRAGAGGTAHISSCGSNTRTENGVGVSVYNNSIQLVDAASISVAVFR